MTCTSRGGPGSSLQRSCQPGLGQPLCQASSKRKVRASNSSCRRQSPQPCGGEPGRGQWARSRRLDPGLPSLSLIWPGEWRALSNQPGEAFCCSCPCQSQLIRGTVGAREAGPDSIQPSCEDTAAGLAQLGGPVASVPAPETGNTPQPRSEPRCTLCPRRDLGLLPKSVMPAPWGAGLASVPLQVFAPTVPKDLLILQTSQPPSSVKPPPSTWWPCPRPPLPPTERVSHWPTAPGSHACLHLNLHHDPTSDPGPGPVAFQ